MFEYSSDLFCHSSDIGHGYREFPLRGIQGATTVPSVEFSPDSTVASVWVTEGSGVSLDVWSSIKQLLVRPKDKILKERVVGPVYHTPCDICEASYIGETERSLKSRFMEHRRPSSTTSGVPSHTS